MRTVLVYFGWLFVMGLIVVGVMASCSPAHAAGNAADVRGRFVLVVGGTATGTMPAPPYGTTGSLTYRLPLTVVGTFDSFKLCTGAGRELQARFNTDGYTLDFSCIAEGL